MLISPLPAQEGKKLQRQKILSFIYPIYNHNWRNISTIYIYNKTSIKRNILTIKKIHWEVGRAKDLPAPLYTYVLFVFIIFKLCFSVLSIYKYRDIFYTKLLIAHSRMRRSTVISVAFAANNSWEFVCCLFSWRYNPLWLYFHSPVAGFSLLVFDVSWSHTATHHNR